MVVVNKGDLLTRVRKYELKRCDEKFRIDVHEVLAGSQEHRFFAIPSLPAREDSDVDERYIGRGHRGEEAIEDCLKKIKDVPVQEIFPPLV